MSRVALAMTFLLILICVFVPAYANSNTEGFDLYSIPQRIQISNTNADIVRDAWHGGYLRIKNPNDKALLYYTINSSIAAGMELVATNAKITFIGFDSKGTRRNTAIVDLLKDSVLLNGEKCNVDFSSNTWHLLKLALTKDGQAELYIDNKLVASKQTLYKGIVNLSGVLINLKGETAIDNLFWGDESANISVVEHKEYGYGKNGTDSTSGFLFQEDFQNASNPPKRWTKTSLVASTEIKTDEANKFYTMNVTDTGAYGAIDLVLPKALSTEEGVLDISFSAKLSNLKDFEQLVVLGSSGAVTALDFTEDGTVRVSGQSINAPMKIVKDKWHNYRMIVYLLSDKYDLYIDGESASINIPIKTVNTKAITGFSFRQTNGSLSIDNLMIFPGVGRLDMKTGDEAIREKALKEALSTSIITKVNSPTMYVLNIKTTAGFSNPPQMAYLSQGVAYIPAKAISQALGALPTISGETVKMSKNNLVIEASIGSNELIVNGQKKIMKASLQDKDGVIYIPANDIASAFGQNSYTGADGLIVISTVNNIVSNTLIVKDLNNLF